MLMLYIAGPMSSFPRFNYPAFHEAATALRQADHTGADVATGGFRLFAPEGSARVARVGKRNAGRELDGRTWGEMPRGLV